MDTGFTEANSMNLPQVDVDMVSQFFIDNSQYFGAEMKNVKTQKSTKESYGDNAMCYVQVKRAGEMCTVRAKITAEHKIRKKPYKVEVSLDERNEKVISCSCVDCAASAGGCKHAVALLFWFHRRSAEPSITSVECYWKASKLSKVGVSEKCMSAKEMAGVEKSHLSDNSHIVSDFIKMAGKSTGGIFDFTNEPKLSNVDIYQLILKYRSEDRQPCAEGFLEFAKTIIGNDFSHVEKCTRELSKCSEWYQLRFGRITASKVYETAKCKTDSGSLMEKIMGATKPFETLATNRGKELEPLVINEVEKIKNIKIKKTGLILSSNYPVMGASPDGLSEEYCIEVKCPSKEKTLNNYVKDNIINKKYYYQLQMQMLFANKSKGLFCVASTNFERDRIVNIADVSLNKEDISDILNLALQFWKEYVYKHLIKV